MAGTCRVLFLDESGFGLWLPMAYSWTTVGTVRGVLRGGGRVGRVNVMGHLDWSADGTHRIGFAVVSGSCQTEVVVRYLDRLAQEGGRRGVPTVVYLDNASFQGKFAIQNKKAPRRGAMLCAKSYWVTS